MSKLLVTATISGPSHNDVEQTGKSILNALKGVKDRMNNGSEIKISTCNGESADELKAMMGDIKWWSLGREPDGFSEHKRQASKKRKAGISQESIEDDLLDL